MAKAALTLETAAPMPHTASSLPDIHLALRGVSHTYPARADQGPVPALGRLDFEFRRGEFFGVVGLPPEEFERLSSRVCASPSRPDGFERA